MTEYRRIISDLFGEDGFSEDEQTIREQQALKKRLKDAFGSDSESEERTEQWDDTSVSGNEDNHETDALELAHSDIDDEPVQLQVGKIEPISQDDRRLAKEFAQFQRQMAARINKQRYNGEVNQYGLEVFQQAEEMLRKRNLIEATIASIRVEPTATSNPSAMTKDNDQAEIIPKPTRAERRAAAKRAWYKRKR
ncbi:unnamed protein product [Aphis gossypii]|uniref:Uncharacterized protein n=1 Tax=Aphis gossypii TaxID=80765 RepID=A0A9P0NFA1_APHGO|nr:unnamed protein product [Aphis gossypii]